MSVNNTTLANFTDIFADDHQISESQPLSLTASFESQPKNDPLPSTARPAKYTGQQGEYRSVEEIDEKYRCIFTYPYFNLVQSKVLDDALYSDKSLVICAPTGSGKTVVFEMAIVQLLMQFEDTHYKDDFKIIYMAPVKAICTERLTEWYPKFNRLGLQCIEVTGDTDVDFFKLRPYKVIITTPEKWDVLTRRWTNYRGLVHMIKLFLIDEVHILNDECRGPVLEAVVSRMKTIELSSQSEYRIEQLKRQYGGQESQSGGTQPRGPPPRIRFVAVSATVCNPEDVAAWLGTEDRPAVFHKYGEEYRPVKLRKVVEGYPCPDGMSMFKFDIILSYKLWPIIQKYYNGKPTLIFCNTRKSVVLTAETLSREITITFNTEQRAKLNELAAVIKNKKLQSLILNGVGCHHAGLLYEERISIEQAFRQRGLPILITTSTLAMGVNLPAHLVIIKNTCQYAAGEGHRECSSSSLLQMLGRAGRPQYDQQATAVIMTRAAYKARYTNLVEGTEPLQSSLHLRLTENLNSEAALRTVCDVAQCVQWLRSTFLYVRARKDPKKYLGLPSVAEPHLISKKIEELCIKAMNGLASNGLITMDDASCIESTVAGRLMSVYYLDYETMKNIMKIDGSESLERLLWVVCESHELSDMHLRVDERRTLNLLNRNNAAPTIRYPMKGKISTRQMKLNCLIQAVLGCIPIPDPSLNQEAIKIMRIVERICKCMVSYITQPAGDNHQVVQRYAAARHSALLTQCVTARLWHDSQHASRQLRGIGAVYSTLLAAAGKYNFMLLEESHPRDLERIMNKGPPAGNLLRKQICLLPKYQLTVTPIDENTVKLHLMLLNQNYLSENMNNLTAGQDHLSYIIVGDSENYLLLFKSFTDKNLITLYDGTITHVVKRIHRFNHKLFVDCMSSSFVGIDAHLEYVFNDLDPHLPTISNDNLAPTIAATPRKDTKKIQTNITDTFKERKRKVRDNDITLSREKKKRENPLIEKFESLKKSFGITSKALQDDLKKTAVSASLHKSELTNKKDSNLNKTVIDELEELETNAIFETEFSNTYKTNSMTDYVTPNDIDVDESFLDEDRIDCILNEIENEISKDNKKKQTQTFPDLDQTVSKKYLFKNPNSRVQSCDKFKKIANQNNKKNYTQRNNYSFIELLEKNIDLTDDDDLTYKKSEDNIFSNTLKNNIQQYLDIAKAKLTDSPNKIEKQYFASHKVNRPEANKQNYFKDSPIQNQFKSGSSSDVTIVLSDDLDTLPECVIKDKSRPKTENNNYKEVDIQLIENNVIDTSKSQWNSINFNKNSETLDINEDNNELEVHKVIQNLSTHDIKDDDDDYVDKFITKDGIKENDKQVLNTGDNTRVKKTDLNNYKIFQNYSTENDKFITNDSISENDMQVLNTGDNTKIKTTDINNSKIFQNDSTENYSIQYKTSDNIKQKHKEILSRIENTKVETSDSKHSNSSLVPYKNENLYLDCPVNKPSQIRATSNDDIKNISLIPWNYNDSIGICNFNHNKEHVTNNFTVTNNLYIDKIPNKNSMENTGNTQDTLNVEFCNENNLTLLSSSHNHETSKSLHFKSVSTKKYSYDSSEVKVITNKEQNCKFNVIKKLTVDIEIQEHRYDKERENTSSVYETNSRSPIHNMIDLNKDIFNEIHEVSNKSKVDVEIQRNTPESYYYHNSTHVEKTKQVDINETGTVTERDAEKLNHTDGTDNGHSAVDKLLTKYVSKLKDKIENTQTIKKDNSSKTFKPQAVKPKRPFRISDIHEVKAVLPENLIDKSVELCNSDYQIDTNIKFKELNLNVDMDKTEDINDCSDDIPEISPSSPSKQEPISSFSIDQAMLNPKTLLQFMAPDQNEIIPPPPQFCDDPDGDEVYDCEFSNNLDLMETYDGDDEKVNKLLFETDDKSYANNVNTNFDIIDCDPSIETWTFSSVEPKSSYKPISCTVARKKYSVELDKSNSFPGRKRNLDQFKFNTKMKFKVTRCSNINQ